MENWIKSIGIVMMLGFLVRTIMSVVEKGKKSKTLNDLVKEADRISKELVERKKTNKENKTLKKREHYKRQNIQMRFSSDKSDDFTPQHTSKYDWDLPVVGVDTVDEVKPKKRKNSTVNERNVMKSYGNRIKTFNEFITPDKLMLDLGNDNLLVHDLEKESFIVNDKKYGASIANVKGLDFLGYSRIDGNPLVEIQTRDGNVVVNVNLREHRFELIHNVEHHKRKDIPSVKSNIDEWTKRGINTRNAMFESKKWK